MKLSENDYRLLMKACLLLTNVSDGILSVTCPPGLERVYETDQYKLTLADAHRLRGLKSEIRGRMEMMRDIKVL